MGLFDRFRRQSVSAEGTVPVPVTISAAAKGNVVPMVEIPDPAFASGAMGYAVGIEPAEGKICAPVDGQVSMLAATRHAIGIRSVNGAEVLIHIGVDTVNMKGDGFSSTVLEGSTVEKGQVILTVDLEKVKAAGHSDVIITAVTNSDDFSTLELLVTGAVEPGEPLVKIQ